MGGYGGFAEMVLFIAVKWAAKITCYPRDLSQAQFDACNVPETWKRAE